MTTETKPCKCGKKMVKRYDSMVLMSMPPQYRYDWYCGCGNVEHGGKDMGTPLPTIHEQWKETNDH